MSIEALALHCVNDSKNYLVALGISFYDFEDRLVANGTGVAQTATYVYDADGSRIQKVTSVGTTNYPVIPTVHTPKCWKSATPGGASWPATTTGMT